MIWYIINIQYLQYKIFYYKYEQVHVSGLTEALLGQATTFTVDAAEAGEGTLELVVSTENNTVKAEVVACARGLYDVTFVPQTTSTHYVNISFNDDNVPGLWMILNTKIISILSLHFIEYNII